VGTEGYMASKFCRVTKAVEIAPHLLVHLGNEDVVAVGHPCKL